MEERAGVVYVTAEEMREIDDITVREFQVDVPMLMENAGRAVADLARRMLQGTTLGKRVACLVGGGNNGGDGMVAARHLANWGTEVKVVLGTSKDKMKDAPLKQLHIIEKMGIPIRETDWSIRDNDLLVDALLGYGLEGNPRDRIGAIIKEANESRRPILAIDIPSGMNATTGEAYDPCIKATSTLSLALPKTGFLAASASQYVGQLYLADISIPQKIYQRFGQQELLFQKDTVLRISA
jgi:NAD(P)H-hydrate epimerase